MLEISYSIFANVLEFDEPGCPVNAKYAEHRAAQYLRQYHDPSYKVSPPFEAWERELHGRSHATTQSRVRLLSRSNNSFKPTPPLGAA